MVRRLLTRRILNVTLLVATALPVAFLAWAPRPAAQTKSNLVRGNAPGEWRYWGADAWSSRYSPLDQINAANFNSLQIAWQFKVGDMFGEDEYFRSTPLYASGKLISVAGGGDTVRALNAAGVASDLTYVSTAGGAFLEWLGGHELPAVLALARSGARASP